MQRKVISSLASSNRLCMIGGRSL